MIQRRRHQFGVAAEGRKNIGLDRGIIGAGHFVLVARGDDHRGDGAEIVALPRREGNMISHRVLFKISRGDDSALPPPLAGRDELRSR